MTRCLMLATVCSLTALVGGSFASHADAATCQPTVTDAGGPFGQGEPPIRATIGKGLILTGVVLDTSCRPVPRARVQFWQSSITDKGGHFRFQTRFPTQYEGLPPHIHVRVDAADFQELVTRFVPAAGTHHGTIRLVLMPPDL
jgi:protocatechuate 3,4-dioxygenase beta subunit